MENAPWDLPYILYENLNEIVEFSSSIITSVCAENIRNKSVTIRTKDKPWMCNEVFLSKEVNNVQFNESCNQSWFDEECRSERKRFYTALNTYRCDKSPFNQSALTNARSTYKKLLRNKRYRFAKAKTDQLIISKSQNAKEYWKLLKQAANLKTKCSIDAKRFSEYFKAISDPNDRFYQPDEDILYFNDRYAQGEFQVMFEELDLPISIGEIKKGISQLVN